MNRFSDMLYKIVLLKKKRRRKKEVKTTGVKQEREEKCYSKQY